MQGRASTSIIPWRVMSVIKLAMAATASTTTVVRAPVRGTAFLFRNCCNMETRTHRAPYLGFARSTIKLGMPAGMVATIAMVAGPMVPLCSPTRTPGSTAISSLGQAGPLADFALRFATKRDDGEGEIDQTPVVPVEWLHQQNNNPNVKVVDASWYMPGDQRDPLKEFQDSHIPGAVFFDVDGISDVSSDLPHMLPSESAFAAAVSALGIRNENSVIVYDDKGIFSAARVWWMFRAFGHEKVWVLDGGLPQWRASGFPLESDGSQVALSEAATAAVKKSYEGEQVAAGSFKATLQPHLVWSADQVKSNIKEKRAQQIDARGKARFDGIAPEPRQGVRGGHVPGSKCIPFTEVLSSTGTLLAPEELAAKFSNAGVGTDEPIVASCGTGVTACILALALHRLGKQDVAIYDGSWTEWGALPDSPVATNLPA